MPSSDETAGGGERTGPAGSSAGSSSGGGERSRRWPLAGALLCAAGLGLVLLALPRLQATLLAADALALFHPARSGELAAADDERLAELEDDLRRAAAADRTDHHYPYARAGLLAARAAAQPLTEPGVEAQLALLDAARLQAEAAVRAAPARTDAWGRLLLVEHTARGLTPLAIEALRMSYATGARDPQPMRVRLAIGLAEWARLPPDLRERTRVQIDDMWRARMLDHLAEVALGGGGFAHALVMARAPDEAARRGMQRRLQRLMQRQPSGG